MTPTPSNSTTPSSSGAPPDVFAPNNEQHRVIRKRNRVPLSCAPCRNRKLKCNRTTPCENCVKRGDATSCSYASPGPRRKTNARVSPATTPDDMQHRIDRLEGLVLSLMTNGNDSVGPTEASRSLSMSSSSQQFTPSQPDDSFHNGEGESETEKVAKSLGVMHVANNKVAYLGDAHWSTILNDITEVRNYFGEHKKQYEDAMKKVEASKQKAGQAHYSGPAFILGARSLPQFSELLASLPGRDAVDKMVGSYFNDFDPSTHILHPPSWRRSYERHWLDPEKTTPAFLGQLFAICGLAMQSFHKNQNEPYEYRGQTLNLAQHYRMLTQQCLLSAEYFKPEHSVIEMFILHLQSEYTKTGDADIGLWILTGTVVRLAMRMGLHRDSQHYPDISPFQSEIRRRLWAFVRNADVIFSFSIGLPSMIRSTDCDTELPRNLHDEDFDEDTKTLPPSRPSSELTGMSYMIAKSSIAFVFGKIVERTHTVEAPAYEEIMTLDREIMEAYHGLPPLFHMKPMEESNHDPISTLEMRFHISMLYNKSLCVLHRKYLVRARENSRYAHSRRACIDASMTLLHHQETLYRESQPGKRMHKGQWYGYSHQSHDFILAATLVCLDLLHSAQDEATGRSTGDLEMWGTDRREEMLAAVEYSNNIWNELRDRYIEAFKAQTMINVMLQKIQAVRAQTAARMAQGAFSYAAANGGGSGGGSSKGDAAAGAVPASTAQQQQFGPSDDIKPEHSAAITLGMLSSGGQPNGVPGAYSNGPYPPTPGSTNATMTDLATGSGLTPNFAVDGPPGGAAVNAVNAPSPFSFFNGANMEMTSNIDWASWDHFIQNSNMDPIIDMWGQTMDAPPPNADGSVQGENPGVPLPQQQQQQLNSNLFANNPALFPPGTTL